MVFQKLPIRQSERGRETIFWTLKVSRTPATKIRNRFCGAMGVGGGRRGYREINDNGKKYNKK